MDLLNSLKLRNITKKLGSIVISDDKIDCYVDNDKLRRLLEKKNNLLSLDSSDLKIAYGIDKPITYHISDYSFDGIVISTTDSIHFSNCTFNNEVTIAALEKTISDKTKAVSIAHITNVVGELVSVGQALTFIGTGVLVGVTAFMGIKFFRS